jgi:HEAT repeat protein
VKPDDASTGVAPEIGGRPTEEWLTALGAQETRPPALRALGREGVAALPLYRRALEANALSQDEEFAAMRAVVGAIARAPRDAAVPLLIELCAWRSERWSDVVHECVAALGRLRAWPELLSLYAGSESGEALPAEVRHIPGSAMNPSIAFTCHDVMVALGKCPRDSGSSPLVLEVVLRTLGHDQALLRLGALRVLPLVCDDRRQVEALAKVAAKDPSHGVRRQAAKTLAAGRK